MDSLKMSAEFDAEPKKLYDAWMDSKKHSDFTDSPAMIDAKVGGKFTAWDDYISGTNIKLIPNEKIVQKWRTTEFPDEAPDSDLEIIFEPNKDGTKITLTHTNIPDGQGDQYEVGWKEFYFELLKEYLSK